MSDPLGGLIGRAVFGAVVIKSISVQPRRQIGEDAMSVVRACGVDERPVPLPMDWYLAELGDA